MVDLATYVDPWTDKPAGIHFGVVNRDPREPDPPRLNHDPMNVAHVYNVSVVRTDQDVVRSAIFDYSRTAPAQVRISTAEPDWRRVAKLLKQITLIIAKPDPQEILSNRIASFGALPKGWDGADAEPLAKSAIADGLAFLSFLDLSRSVPHISVAADGELAFIWDKDDRYLEISFYGDGELYFYRRGNNEKKAVSDSVPFTGKSVPREIDSLIREMD